MANFEAMMIELEVTLQCQQELMDEQRTSTMAMLKAAEDQHKYMTMRIEGIGITLVCSAGRFSTDPPVLIVASTCVLAKAASRRRETDRGCGRTSQSSRRCTRCGSRR